MGILKFIKYTFFGDNYNKRNENDRLKFQSKRFKDYGRWKTYYFSWRDYDSKIGRWHVKDPLYFLHFDLNPYNFVSNNPINGVDLAGLTDFWIIHRFRYPVYYNESWHIHTTEFRYLLNGVEPISTTRLTAPGHLSPLIDGGQKDNQGQNRDSFDNPFDDVMSGGISGDAIDMPYFGFGYGNIIHGGGGSGRRKGSNNTNSVTTTVSSVSTVSGIITDIQRSRYVTGNRYYNSYYAKWYSLKFYGNNFESSIARMNALQIAKGFKIAGFAMFVISIGSSVVDFGIAWYNNDSADMTYAVFDGLASFAITFGGPIGIASGLIYYAVRYAPGFIDDVVRSIPKQYEYMCFIKGTKILMGNVTIKNIEEVRIGDEIKTYNFQKNKIENQIVIETISVIHYNFIEISFSNGIVNTSTLDHPYYVVGKGWCSYKPEETSKKYNITVNKLEVGDLCYYYDGNKIIDIKILSFKEIHKRQTSYNLSKVKSNKNFFANGILVHNKKR